MRQRRRVSVVTVTRWHYGSQPLEEHQKLTVLRDSSSLFSFVSVCIIVCILFTCVESVGSFTRLQLKFSCTCSQNLHQYHNSRNIVVYCCDHCHLHQDERRNFERFFTFGQISYRIHAKGQSVVQYDLILNFAQTKITEFREMSDKL